LKKILGLAMVLVLALGVTGCGGSGGGGGNDPIFPIEVSSNSKIIKTLPAAPGPDYDYDYSCQIELKNISDNSCSYIWNLEFWSGGKMELYTDHKWDLHAKDTDKIVSKMARSYNVDKAVLIITVGTETKRFNIPVVMNPTAF
jgi:hypothetical protein